MNLESTAMVLLDFLRGGAGLGRITGPIFDKELRVASRRRHTHILRAAYVALLAAFVGVAWWAEVGQTSYAPMYQAYRMAEAGKFIVAVMLWFQFCALQLVAIMMLSNAISEEVNRRTLGVLIATPITSLQIVAGKLGSRLLQVMLLLAVSLPVMMVVRVFGGVPMGYVLAGVSITVTAVLFCGSLSLFLSIRQRRVWLVVLMTFIALGLMFVLFPLLVGVLFRGGRRDDVMIVLAYGNPYLALLYETAQAMSPRGMGAFTFHWPVHCAIMLGLSGLLVAMSAVGVRRVAMRQALGGSDDGGPKARPPAGATRLRRVHGPPMVWIESARSTFGSRRKTVVVVVIGLALLLLTYLLMSDELRYRDVNAVFSITFAILGMLTTLTLAATTVTTERESQTWPLLLCTPLGSREIVFGKAVGVLRRSLPVWGLWFFHLLVLMPFGYTHPVMLVHAAMLTVGMACLATGTGLFFSSLVRRTTTAVVLNVLFHAFLWAGIPTILLLICELLIRKSVLAEGPLCLNAFVQVFVTMSPREPWIESVPVTEQYNWPDPLDLMGWLATTMVVGLTMVGYVVVAAGFAAAAAARLRRKDA